MGLCGVGAARLIQDRCVLICAVGLCSGGPVCGERLLSAGEMKSLCVGYSVYPCTLRKHPGAARPSHGANILRYEGC